MSRLKAISGAAAALAAVFGALSIQAGFSAPPSAASDVVTIDPARILDTRSAVGVTTTTPVKGQETVSLQVAGAGGVPVTATGVIITITATQATTNTFITATPAGTPRSETSVLNVTPGTDIANTVTMSLGTGGKIELFSNAGSVHLVADVTGYMLPGGASGPAPGTVVTKTFELGVFDGIIRGPGTADPSTGCVAFGIGGQVDYTLPVPDGAVIQKLDIRYFDNTATPQDQTFLLYEVDQLDPTQPPTIAGTLSNNQVNTPSGNTTNYHVITMTPGGSDKASSTVHYQFTAANVLGGATGQAFCGATVTYQFIQQ